MSSMKLIPDWRQAWRFFSVAGSAAIALANLVIANSDALQVILPAHTVAVVNAVAAIAIGVSRVIQQKNPRARQRTDAGGSGKRSLKDDHESIHPRTPGVRVRSRSSRPADWQALAGRNLCQARDGSQG